MPEMKNAKKITWPSTVSELVPAGSVLVVVPTAAKAASVWQLPRYGGEPGTPVTVDLTQGFSSPVSGQATSWRISALTDRPVYYAVTGPGAGIILESDPPIVPAE
ncbi:hypothetical protein [Sphingomonas sp. MA1305]|uniref:hypothetical protein n=1 Tax=Sphingomonas sp. MA1305 TaxID=2479204 RepID=UPI0018E02C87|nr:hypothetical protein [Sphingomonas sp. MA1305]